MNFNSKITDDQTGIEVKVQVEAEENLIFSFYFVSIVDKYFI